MILGFWVDRIRLISKVCTKIYAVLFAILEN